MIYDVGKHGLVCDHCGAVQVLPGPGEQGVAAETDLGSATLDERAIMLARIDLKKDVVPFGMTSFLL
jgi:hypothetical protein